MNKPMQYVAIAWVAVAVLGGTATAAEVRGTAPQKQRGVQAAKKQQPANARKRAVPSTGTAAKPAPKRPVAPARSAAKPAARPASRATTKPGSTPATATAKAAARAVVPARPPEVHWTQLPPSRFYPNGIPELRPEFLHPEPSQRPVQAFAAPASPSHGPTDDRF